jgi:hypothetical protein
MRENVNPSADKAKKIYKVFKDIAEPINCIITLQETKGCMTYEQMEAADKVILTMFDYVKKKVILAGEDDDKR